MVTRALEHMYQAWQQGNDNYASDWYLFVSLAANHYQVSIVEILKILEDCPWFIKN